MDNCDINVPCVPFYIPTDHAEAYLINVIHNEIIMK